MESLKKPRVCGDKPCFLRRKEVEKLTVEIELTKEEMDDFNNLIELECLDQTKWIKRVITEVVQRRLEKHLSRNAARKLG